MIILFIYDRSLMNLNHLEAFCVLSNELSFSRTAKILKTSQPAISYKIKMLEEALGYELFMREKKKISLSLNGQKLKDQIYQSYLTLSSIDKPLDSEKTIRIGSIYEAGQIILSPHLNRLIKNNKLISYELQLKRTDDLIDQLLSGELDFIFINKIPEHKIIESMKVCEDRAVLIGAPKTSYRDFEEKEKKDFISYSHDDLFTLNFLKRNFPKKTRETCELKNSINSHYSMIATVVDLKCYAVLPKSSLRQYDEKKVIVLMEGKEKYQLYLCARSNFLENKKNRKIFEQIGSIF